MKQWMKRFFILFVLANINLLATTFLYIANSGGGSNFVTVINTETDAIVGSIPLPTVPAGGGLAISKNGRFVYAPDTVGNVYVIDTSTNNIVKTITGLDSGAGNPKVAPDGSKLYITCTNAVDVIDTATNTLTAKIAIGTTSPGYVVFSPNSSTAYVTCPSLNTVRVINTATSVLDPTSISLNAGGATAGAPIVISPDGVTLYVTSASTISAYNTVTTVTTTYALPSGNGRQLGITPDGTKVYVGINATGTAVNWLNVNTGLVSVISTPGFRGYFIAITPDGSQVFTGGFEGPQIPIIKTALNTSPATMVTIGASAYNQASVMPNSKKAYIQATGGGSVISVFDITTETYLQAITLPAATLSPSLIVYTPQGGFSTTSTVSGVQTKNNFGLEYELVNQVSWTAAPLVLQSTLAFYQIYRDPGFTQLVATLPTNTFTYFDHDRKKGQSYTYYIAAVSSTGSIDLIGSTTISP